MIEATFENECSCGETVTIKIEGRPPYQTHCPKCDHLHVILSVTDDYGNEVTAPPQEAGK